MLQRMRRRYNATDFSDTVGRIHNAVPDVAITADVIAGFPGETDSDFRDTVDMCVESELASVHVFPYSIRPGTSAAYYSAQVHAQTKTERAAELSAVAHDLSRNFKNRFLGGSREVLWERAVGRDASEHQFWSGLTDNYIRVRASTEADLTNQITTTRLTSIDGEWVKAEILD